jgi:spore maturation protein CgeB
MKIIIPNYRPPDSFVDNVAFTLKLMGHEVLTMSLLSNKRINSRYRRFWTLARQKLSSNYIPPREVWLLKQVQSQKPDVVLTLTQALSEQTLAELKKKGILTAVWWGDTPANMRGQGLLCEGWDAVFIKDKNAVDKLNRVGIYSELCHEAMNPQWHKPIPSKRNRNLVIAGSLYEYRHFLVRKLLQNNVGLELYGQRPPIWADPNIKKIHTGKFIVKEEKSKVFGAGLACLNSTAMSEFNSLNCRAFEIAGARGLQILEYRPIVSKCFEPGKEILIFETFNELLEIIARVRKEPQYAEKIREAGHQRALKEHTYEKRLRHIINTLKRRG